MKTVILLLVFFGRVAFAEVPYERILRAESEPGNWLTYSGNYRGGRHTSLTQINRANVNRLKPAWIYQLREPGRLETSPIVVDGIVYVTEKSQSVTALDGKTGRPLWKHNLNSSKDFRGCCGDVNRGPAVLNDALFVGTIDAHLVALDMRTGNQRWKVKIADHKTGHSITAAPLAVKDKVIVGISGGDLGIRGFLDAYDAKTGKQAWRFWTIPGPGEPGHKTWEGDSWKTGGGGTWVTGSYDAELNLIYWPAGNPGPDFNGDYRKGDNLYSNCLLAIDADTGKLRWYFQFTPHDVNDWSANQVPVLIDGVVNGRTRKLVVQANRNAFYYVLDRVTGEFLSGTPYTKQTWARGLDARGRPIRLPNTVPSTEGTLIYPGIEGGTNWQSPSYSPQTGLFYVAAQDNYGQVFYKLKPQYKAGAMFEAGFVRNVPGVEGYGATKALDALTGKLKWEFKLHSLASGGLLSTAGGLVFGGDREGNFFALDAGSGKPLWHFQTGGWIWGNPVSFEINKKQHVAVAAGQAIFAFTVD
ncbi:MAG: pyrroloquinoline quinone-dependent dehydrogenase [Candidatus Binatia bacterium]